VTLTVSLFPVTMEISCWNSSFPYGGNYQCIANADSGPLQGYITYSLDGGPAVTLNLNNSAASFTINLPPVGNHNVVVIYPQQGNNAAFTLPTQYFAVTPAPVQVSIVPNTSSAEVGFDFTFLASVTSWSAGPPNGIGSISFYDGTTLIKVVPVNANGQATLNAGDLCVGSHTITATYGGGANYGTGSAYTNVTVTK